MGFAIAADSNGQFHFDFDVGVDLHAKFIGIIMSIFFFTPIFAIFSDLRFHHLGIHLLTNPLLASSSVYPRTSVASSLHLEMCKHKFHVSLSHHSLY